MKRKVARKDTKYDKNTPKKWTLEMRIALLCDWLDLRRIYVYVRLEKDSIICEQQRLASGSIKLSSVYQAIINDQSLISI